MDIQLTINSKDSLLDNLNSIEAQLRTHGLLSETDTLIAITENPLDPESVTIGPGITIKALGDQLSVHNPDANISIDPPKDSE